MEEPGARPRGRGPHSSLPEELTKYFVEVGEQLSTLDEPAEKRLLADNAFAEMGERALEVAADPVCSRVVETLAKQASARSLARFLDAACSEERIAFVCTGGPFVSRVVEAVLAEAFARSAGAEEEVGPEEEEDGEDEDDENGEDPAKAAAVARGAVTRFSQAVAGALFDVITTRHGSFLARKLLTLACGRDLSDGGLKGAGGKKGGHGGGTGGTGGMGGGRCPGFSSGSWGAAPREDVVDLLLESACGEDWVPELAALRSDAFAAPFLQALLRACSAPAPGAEPDAAAEARASKAVRAVLGCAPAGADPDQLRSLMRDQRGSHVAEALFEAAPEADHAALATAALRGAATQLATDPRANHAVQAAVRNVRRPAQLRRLFGDLRPSLGDLLRGRKGGVVLALLSAARRLLPEDPEIPSSVAQAATALDPAQGPLGAILTYDLPRGRRIPGMGSKQQAANQDQGEDAGEGAEDAENAGDGASTSRSAPAFAFDPSSCPRLSPLGCAIAIEALSFEPAAAKPWTNAVATASREATVNLAADPGGARVLEAYLRSVEGAPRKVRALVNGLKGSFAKLAQVSGASLRFVERCFDLASPDTKRSIAEELAAARTAILALHQGPALLQRCMVDELAKTGADDWQRKLQAAENVREEFQELFGAPPKDSRAERENAQDQEHDEKQNGSGKRKNKDKKEKKDRKKSKKARE